MPFPAVILNWQNYDSITTILRLYQMVFEGHFDERSRAVYA